MEKNIKVYQKGTFLDYTTLKRARRLTEKRSEAVWISPDAVLLIGGRKERKKIKKELLEKEGKVCYICGRIIPKEEFPTLDHIYPKKLQGSDVKENCAICCFMCNQKKGNMILSDFLKKVSSDPSFLPYLSPERIRYLDDLYIKKHKEV